MNSANATFANTMTRGGLGIVPFANDTVDSNAIAGYITEDHGIQRQQTSKGQRNIDRRQIHHA